MIDARNASIRYNGLVKFLAFRHGLALESASAPAADPSKLARCRCLCIWTGRCLLRQDSYAADP